MSCATTLKTVVAQGSAVPSKTVAPLPPPLNKGGVVVAQQHRLLGGPAKFYIEARYIGGKNVR